MLVGHLARSHIGLAYAQAVANVLDAADLTGELIGLGLVLLGGNGAGQHQGALHCANIHLDHAGLLVKELPGFQCALRVRRGLRERRRGEANCERCDPQCDSEAEHPMHIHLLHVSRVEAGV